MLEIFKKYTSVYKMMLGLGIAGRENMGAGNEVASDKLEKSTIEALRDQTAKIDQKMVDDMKDFLLSNDAIKDIRIAHLTQKDIEKALAELPKDKAEHFQLMVDARARFQKELQVAFNGYDQEKQVITNEAAINLKNTEVKMGFFRKNDRVKLYNRLPPSSQSTLDNLMAKEDLSKLSSLVAGNKPSKDFLNKINSLSRDYNFSNADQYAVFATIKDFTDLQNQINNAGNLSNEQLANLIADLNLDGDTNDSGANVTEAQIVTAALEYQSTVDYNVLDRFFSNIGLGSTENFRNELRNNAYATIKKVHTAIEAGEGTGYERLSELFTSDREKSERVNNHIEADKKLREEAQSAGKKIMDADPKRYGEEGSRERLKVRKLIDIGVSVGAINGVGVGKDIHEQTKGLLDYVGVIATPNGPDVGVVKELYNKGNTQVMLAISLSGINAVASHTTDKGLTFYGMLGTGGVGAGFTKELKNKGSSNQIEKGASELLSLENTIVSMVKNGEKFNDKKLPGLTEEVYNKLSELYKVSPGEFSHTYQAIVNSMKTTAYINNEGWKLTNVGLGATLSWNPVTTLLGLVGAGLERTKVKQTESLTHQTQQIENTMNNLPYKMIDKPGVGKVMLIPNLKPGIQFLAPEGKLQAEFVPEGLLVGGDIKDLHLHTYNGTNGLERAIAFNGATDLEADLVKEPSQITEAVPMTKKIVENSVTGKIEGDRILFNNDLARIETQISALDPITSYSNGALGLRQKLHGSLAQGSLDNWNDFESYYSRIKGAPALPTDLSDAEKFTLLYNFSDNAMDDFNASYMKGMTVNEIDKKFYPQKMGEKMKASRDWILRLIKDGGVGAAEKALHRDISFNKVFKGAGLEAHIGDINDAREDIWAKYEKGEYVSTTTSNEPVLAFVASAPLRGGKVVFSGLTPMAGKLDIASSKKGLAEVKIEDKNNSLRRSLASKMPENWRQNFKTYIEKKTEKKLSVEDLNKILSGETVNGITIGADVFMLKWGTCFNDALSLKNITLDYKGEVTKIEIDGDGPNVSQSFSNSQLITDVNKIGLGVAATAQGQKKEKTTEERKEVETRPGEEDTPDIDTKTESKPTQGPEADLSNNTNQKPDVPTSQKTDVPTSKDVNSTIEKTVKVNNRQQNAAKVLNDKGTGDFDM